MGILSAKIIDTILQVLKSGFAKRASRDETVVRILRKLGIATPDLHDFDGLYTYALVQYGVPHQGIPRPEAVLNVFRDEYIREAFQQKHSLSKTGEAKLDQELENYKQKLQESGKLDELDYDPTGDLVAFQEMFNSVIRKFRPASDPLIVQDVQKIFVAELERHGRATREEIANLGYELGQKIESLEAISHETFDQYVVSKDLLHGYCEDMLELHYRTNLPIEPIPMQGKKDIVRLFTLDGIYINLRLNFNQAIGKARSESPLSKNTNEDRDLSLGSHPSKRLYELEQIPLGRAIAENDRLIIVGDPGSGKTTLMKWLVAGLLSKANDSTVMADYPDIEALPHDDMIPVLIPCKRLPSDESQWTFDRFIDVSIENFRQKIKYSRLLKALAYAGRLLLVFDGLDEIGNGMFVQLADRIQELAAGNKDLSVLITSRGQGYAEAIDAVHTTFARANVRVLDRDDIGRFAESWCKKTFPSDYENKTQKFNNLIVQVPLLSQKPLTLIALAIYFYNDPETQRPNLGKIYKAYMTVLFNWNRKLVERYIPWDESQPQLCHLAYQMTENDQAQISRRNFTKLLKALREEDPHSIINERRPYQFINLLEQGSALVKNVSTQDFRAMDEALYEFQEKKTQEYFAGLSIYEGHHPNFERGDEFKKHFMLLSQQLIQIQNSEKDAKELESISDPRWLQPLVFCMGIGNSREVASVMYALMKLSFEDFPVSKRARAVLLANFLKDSNADGATADDVFRYIIGQLDERDVTENTERLKTPLNDAIQFLQESNWWLDFRLSFLEYLEDEGLSPERQKILSKAFTALTFEKVTASKIDLTNNRQKQRAENYLTSIINDDLPIEAIQDKAGRSNKLVSLPFWDNSSWEEWINELRQDLHSNSLYCATRAALLLMNEIYSNRVGFSPDLEQELINEIGRFPKADFAILWALTWLYDKHFNYQIEDWKPSPRLHEKLLEVLTNSEQSAAFYAFYLLRYYYNKRSYCWSVIAGHQVKYYQSYTLDDKPEFEKIINRWLNNGDTLLRSTMVTAMLSFVGIETDPLKQNLIEILDDSNASKKHKATAVHFLGCQTDEPTIAHLIKRLSSEKEAGQYNAILSLVAIGGNRVESAILKAIKKTSDLEKVKPHIVTLGFLQSPSQDTIKFLQNCTKIESIQAEANEALIRLNGGTILDWKLTSRYLLNNVLVCVLIQGKTPKNELGYAYIAIHLNEFVQLMNDLQLNGIVNPVNYNLTILARFTGEPSKDVQKSMRRKFGFSTSNVIIQRERAWSEKSQKKFESNRVVSTSNSPKDNSENDFPLKNIHFMHVGSGYIKPQLLDYELGVDIFEQYVEMINVKLYPNDDHNNNIEFEDIDL